MSIPVLSPVSPQQFLPLTGSMVARAAAGTAAPPGGLGDVLTAGAMSVLMVVSLLMALMLCGCGYFSWRSFYNNGKGDDIPEASFLDDEGE